MNLNKLSKIQKLHSQCADAVSYVVFHKNLIKKNDASCRHWLKMHECIDLYVTFSEALIREQVGGLLDGLDKEPSAGTQKAKYFDPAMVPTLSSYL